MIYINPLSMIYQTHYPWNIDPLPMEYRPPLPMVYRTPYPWYIDPPTHGISTPYPWNIDPQSMVY